MQNLSKRNVAIVLVFIITAFTFLFTFSALKKNTIEDVSSQKIKIVLDAGHGGVDGGAIGVKTGVKESDVNLSVVKKLKDNLISCGFNVILTRSDSSGLYGIATSNLKKKDMQKRRDIIKKANPDLVISIHMNKFSLSTRRGAQVFYKNTDEKGKKLADNIQTQLNDMKECVKKTSAIKGDYYILNCSEIPSVIVECGFLSNPEDEALLITEQYQENLSYAIMKGIVGYFAQDSFNYFN